MSKVVSMCLRFVNSNEQNKCSSGFRALATILYLPLDFSIFVQSLLVVHWHPHHSPSHSVASSYPNNFLSHVTYANYWALDRRDYDLRPVLDLEFQWERMIDGKVLIFSFSTQFFIRSEQWHSQLSVRTNNEQVFELLLI